MDKKPDIHRLIELQKFLLTFGAIERVSCLPKPVSRRENDIEHSYFLAMAAWFLAPHFPKLDQHKMLLLALAHDLVEIHTGDTPAYGDQSHIDSKPEREKIARQQLAHDWLDFPEMSHAVQEYAEKVTEEAKFVYALDKLLPPMIHYLGGGKSWQDNGVTIERFIAEKEKKIPADSPIYPYYKEILAFFKTKPNLFKQS